LTGFLIIHSYPLIIFFKILPLLLSKQSVEKVLIGGGKNMRNKIIGIFVCILMISCTTMTFALTPFSRDEQQVKHQFFDTAPAPLPLSKGWLKTFGGTDFDMGYSVQQTADSGYIVTGYTTSFGAGGYHVWLLKTDSNGNEEWNKTFGGEGTGYSVQQTTDEGYIITGDKYSNDTYFDVWLIKTDVSGNMMWNKTFGGTETDVGSSVQQTTDGGYIITGWTFLPDASTAVWLIKTDDNGNKLWDKTFGGGVGYSVQQTTDGGYIITGNTASFGAGECDVWLIKTDSNGDKVWDKTFERKTLLATNYNVGRSVQQTSDGGYIIAGWTGKKIYHKIDVWLIKTNSEGYKVWDRTFGGIGDQSGSSVQQTTDGGYIITGSRDIQRGPPREPEHHADVLLIKTNRFGIKLWDRTFGGLGDEVGCSVQQTTDGGYIVTGYTTSFGAGGDVLLIKTNSHGKSKTLPFVYLWLEKLFQRFPHAFPLLRQLMGY
jgi:hypothetical protein